MSDLQDITGAHELHTSQLSVTMARRLGNDLCYVAKWGWHRWRGDHWDESSEEEALEAVRLELALYWEEEVPQRLLAAADKKEAQAVVKLWATLLSLQTMKAVRQLLAGELLRNADDFDANPYELNCRNGVVDLRTGKLRKRKRGESFRKCAPLKYDPKAKSKAWRKALKAVNPDVRDWLQLRFGRSLIGARPPGDRVVFLHGGGSNGKSTIVDAVAAAIGKYYTTIPPQLLLSRADAHTTDLTDLLGARTAILEELPEGRYLNTTMLKRIAGTEKIKARRMRQDNIEFPATHTPFVTTNYDLRIGETDHGVWRRIWIVPFTRTYVNHEPQSSNEIRAEVWVRELLGAGDPAVLAWLVEGARRAIETPAAFDDPPETVRLATVSSKDENDTMTQFLDECATFAEDEFASTAQLVKAYNEWMEQRGHTQRITSQTVGSRMQDSPHFLAYGLQRDRVMIAGSRSWGYRGLRVSPPGAVFNRLDSAFVHPSGFDHPRD